MDYLERRILSIYSTLSGLRKTEAEVRYLELAKKIPVYGVTMFDVNVISMEIIVNILRSQIKSESWGSQRMDS
jgi:hypothetical protein